MSATLRPHSENDKVLTPEDYVEEHIDCDHDDCSHRYVMAYPPADAEARTEEGSSVVDTMREKAAELLAATHSAHDFRNYVWAGLQSGWVVVEKDLTAAGL